MLKKIKLSIVCLLLVTLFAVQPCLADGVQIEPHQIILNAGGSGNSAADQTIQASIGGTGVVENCTATLEIDGKGLVDDIDFHYCYVDNILHIYFDREAVLESLGDMGTKMNCTATVVYSINNGASGGTVTDKVDVIDPDDGKGNKN